LYFLSINKMEKLKRKRKKEKKRKRKINKTIIIIIFNIHFNAQFLKKNNKIFFYNIIFYLIINFY